MKFECRPDVYQSYWDITGKEINELECSIGEYWSVHVEEDKQKHLFVIYNSRLGDKEVKARIPALLKEIKGSEKNV